MILSAFGFVFYRKLQWVKTAGKDGPGNPEGDWKQSASMLWDKIIKIPIQALSPPPPFICSLLFGCLCLTPLCWTRHISHTSWVVILAGAQYQPFTDDVRHAVILILVSDGVHA